MKFRKSEYQDIERELRGNRPQPRSEFVATLAVRVALPVCRSGGARRLGLAAALSAAMLAALSAFGGASYAASAVRSASHISKITRVIGVSHQSHHARAVVRSHRTSHRATSASRGMSFFGNG